MRLRVRQSRAAIPGLRSARRAAAALAVACCVAFAALYAVAVGTSAGRSLDEDILNNALEGSAPAALANALVDAVDPIMIAVVAVALVWFAVLRRGFRAAAAVSISMVGANVSAALLKSVLREWDPLAGEHARDLGAGFYPSGHATATMAIAVTTVVLAPSGRGRRRAALVGGLAAGAVGVSIVVVISHHASDVAGGFLLATAWIAGAWTIVLARSGRSPRPRVALVAAVTVAALGALATGLAAALASPALPVVGAASTCALALVLASAVAALGTGRE